MKWFNVPVILSRYHNNQLKIKHGRRHHITEISTAADLAGVKPRTVGRWIDGTQAPPESALRLFAVAFFGVMPWPEWEPFTMTYGRDNHGRLRWLITHNEIMQFWTPERLALLAHGYDRAQELKRERDTLQACVTALSTREDPPIPCAEIINLEPHRQIKKSPA